MIETTVLNYLGDKLDVPVLMELPEVPSEDFPVFPEEVVVIEKIADSVSNMLHTASIAIQSYSTNSLYDAAALDERVRKAMDAIEELNEIGGASMESNYNFTNTGTKRYRYQCVYDIVYY